ncbi:MAG: ABC transporter substrate-binding protein [Deferrisomatales bacterium]|nr:ABC transporter substrate-binding protein [Deferrisomatales bacterium]
MNPHRTGPNRTGQRARHLARWTALAVLVTLCACTDKTPVQIGFVGGLSGRVADLGISGRDGVLLAVEQRNAQGGIHGRPVRLLVRDDRQDPETARVAVQELIDSGVAAIVGPMTSSMAMATVPLVNRHQVVMVSPTVTTTDLSGLDDFFLRVSATTRDYAHKTARHLAEKVGVRSATLVYDLSNESYTRSWTDNFKQEFLRLGGRVAGEVTFTSGDDAVMHELARRAAGEGADAVVVSAGAMDAALFCQQFAKLPGRPHLAVSEWAATERFLELGGTAAEGVLVDQFFDRHSAAPAYLAFRDRYRERHDTAPGFIAVNAYDAANLVMEALDRRQGGENLKQTILGMGGFQGVQGSLVLDPFGESDRRAHLSVVRNGRFVPVD